jgi:hypothetical protein
MSTPYKDVDSNAIIADIQKVAREHGPVTRVQYRKYGTFSERKIVEKFGGFSNAVQAAGSGKSAQSTPTLVETNEVSGNKWEITLPKTRIHTLPQLLEHAKVDTSIWKVDRFVVNCWEMGFKDSNDKPATQPLYQVKATLVRQVEIADAKAELDSLKTAAKQIAKFPKAIIRSKVDSGLMLEVNLPDLHLGKLSWSKETGFGNYDVKIAVQVFRDALEVLIRRVSHFKFEKIVFITGNDLLHSDNMQGTTTSGTPLDNDCRYHKTFVTARNMMIDAVDRLRLIAPVKVISCPGNHDKLSAWHIADSLECYFHNYDDVEIDNSPRERKYHQFGEVMLMFAHGNTGKKSNYPQIMAAEEKEMWGNTTYREAHTGHIHQVRTEEQYGVRVRTLPALCEPDAWHSANGYVANLRSAEAYVWSKTEGLVTQAFYNADG